MNIFQNISAGLNLGSQIGGAIGSIGARSSILAENQLTREAFSKVNAKRVARELRYSQGQSATANAAGGHGVFGSAILATAANARTTEERVQEVGLRATVQGASERGSTPRANTFGNILGAVAQFSNDTFESDF